MNKRKQRKVWGMQSAIRHGLVVAYWDDKIDPRGIAVTVIEGHQPVYTWEDIKKAFHVGYDWGGYDQESADRDHDMDSLIERLRAYRQTLEGK